MQTIVPNLTFKKDAEEAVKMYVSLFDSVFGNSKILKTTYYSQEDIDAIRNIPEVTEDDVPGFAGSAKTIRFTLNGQEFMAVNGGGYPGFGNFTESWSIYVRCQTQEQIDKLWEKLSRDAKRISTCGWVTDKFGVSWQIAADVIWEITEGEDKARAQRVYDTIYRMNKIDIEKIKSEAEGK